MKKELRIPAKILDEIILHCKEAYPYEACGILAGRDEEVLKVYRMTNIEKSPVSYMMDPTEQFKIMKEMRESNLSMVAIFHSHPSSPAYPSQKDLNLAFYADSIYVIVGLAGGEQVVKAFSLNEGKAEEVGITVM